MIPYFTLLPEAVATVRAESKAAILEQLATRFAEVYELDRAMVLQRIEQREQLGSTGFGRGFAIPHAHMENLHRPVAVFLRLQAPVPFDAVDSIPVDLIFGLLSPETAGSSHLQALAAISRMTRDERMHEALVRAPDAEALYALLCNVDDRDVA